MRTCKANLLSLESHIHVATLVVYAFPKTILEHSFFNNVLVLAYTMAVVCMYPTCVSVMYLFRLVHYETTHHSRHVHHTYTYIMHILLMCTMQ